ncbi:NAD(P)H-dependent flavin oxidoreductase [Nitrospirillum pindoramense]|uniref:NAD(P)H-dependent flavin oxidoreductase YrpB (Nitropropane dioxygenase family) n=1 Tax=Nitrospirillum amazonense TaxID=28077 RepID=A0A560GS67_9PROT|nr:nitronate monooxygenase [Nitrospirillum amazonense]TWB36865.1 NAD(P)H-dependent flavin oxidoreductase YrpB (nitropropane dioxygenase family) [Nitrospirillum amazonense]
MKALRPLVMSGKEVLPVVEGGKGISVSNGESSGAWASAGGVGTFSGVNADAYDENGALIPQLYHGKTRRERHEELIRHSIRGGIYQARVAHETAGGEGRVHMNVLWEMAAAEQILHGVLEGAQGLIHGITCGAGMPYRVAEIAVKHGVHYYPIVSSARAFRALWLRAYNKFRDFLGGVVYEDPWLAGGHNGLSNSEDPLKPEDPYPRVKALREMMNSFGLNETPIIMAGGVWWLSEWEDWLDNPEIGPIAFQFGTRPLLTQESPISDAWKQRLLTLKKGDVYLNHFSPTGFYSSAVSNPFLEELKGRAERQVAYSVEPVGDLTAEFMVGPRGRPVYLTEHDRERAQGWVAGGNSVALKTPDTTLIFVDPAQAAVIRQDQIDCMGCLSACNFSNWAQNEEGTTGRRADPRSFCIQKTLQNISHSEDVEHQLMFAGHNAYRFASDPWYQNGFVPTVKQLVERIATGY